MTTQRKIFKKFISAIIIAFVLYTLYLILMIKVLNIVSMKSSHNLNSETVLESKKKGYFIATYYLHKKTPYKNVNEIDIPTEIFIEKYRVYMENYYFYFGKSILTDSYSINALELGGLKNKGEFYFCFPDSLGECKDGLTPINHYYKNISKPFDTIPSEVNIYIFKKTSLTMSKPDTLTYQKK